MTLELRDIQYWKVAVDAIVAHRLSNITPQDEAEAQCEDGFNPEWRGSAWSETARWLAGSIGHHYWEGFQSKFLGDGPPQIEEIYQALIRLHRVDQGVSLEQQDRELKEYKEREARNKEVDTVLWARVSATKTED